MTTPPDLPAAALERRRARAFIARARLAPPPPAPPARAVSVAELDAAVAAALARGHSSLEEKRMAKGMIKLAPEPAPNSRASCPVCELALERAHPQHTVCRHCAGDADKARARLTARRQGIERQRDAAVGEYEAALAALDERDARRWAQIAALQLACSRVGRWEGSATDAQRARWEAMRAALLDPQDARVSSALRRLYGADEVRYWAVEGAAAELRRVEAAEAQLADCLAALEAQVAAHGPTVEVAGSKGDTYRVAADGSWCSCPGFQFRGECKHSKAQKERCEEWEFEGITPNS